MTQPNIQNTYVTASGNSNTDAFITFFTDRDPNAQDINYPIQKRWINTILQKEWILQNFTSFLGVVQANWIQLSGTANQLETLQGNTGAPVPPDVTLNIHVVGDGTTIETAGTPLTNTLTITTGDQVATTYTEDTGIATPAAGNLNVVGGAGIQTSGAGDTVTIEVTGDVALQFDEDSGTAIPSSNIINVVNGGIHTGLTTTGSGNTITISGGANLFWIDTKIANPGDFFVDFTSIGPFNNYYVTFIGVTSFSQPAKLYMLQSINNGVSWEGVGSYDSGVLFSFFNSTVLQNVNANDRFWLCGPFSFGSNNSLNGHITIFGCNTSIVLSILGQSRWNDPDLPPFGTTAFGTIGGNGRLGVNAFRFGLDSGIFVSGVFTLYGYNSTFV